MVRQDGDGTVRRAADRACRDPGEALAEAIDLWCAFLKLEGDPLAYRWTEERGSSPERRGPATGLAGMGRPAPV